MGSEQETALAEKMLALSLALEGVAASLQPDQVEKIVRSMNNTLGPAVTEKHVAFVVLVTMDIGPTRWRLVAKSPSGERIKAKFEALAHLCPEKYADS